VREQRVLYVLVQFAVFGDELIVQVDFPLHLFSMHYDNYAVKCIYTPGLSWHDLQKPRLIDDFGSLDVQTRYSIGVIPGGAGGSARACSRWPGRAHEDPRAVRQGGQPAWAIERASVWSRENGFAADRVPSFLRISWPLRSRLQSGAREVGHQEEEFPTGIRPTCTGKLTAGWLPNCRFATPRL